LLHLVLVFLFNVEVTMRTGIVVKHYSWILLFLTVLSDGGITVANSQEVLIDLYGQNLGQAEADYNANQQSYSELQNNHAELDMMRQKDGSTVRADEEYQENMMMTSGINRKLQSKRIFAKCRSLSPWW
jgi:hypothetical protein